ELDVVNRAARERPSEEEREQQREHDGEHRDVEELLRHVLDLQQRPPAESERSRERAGWARALAAGEHGRDSGCLWRLRCTGGFRDSRFDGHAALSSLSAVASCAVMARNTSSRVGRPSENWAGVMSAESR